MKYTKEEIKDMSREELAHAVDLLQSAYFDASHSHKPQAQYQAERILIKLSRVEAEAHTRDSEEWYRANFKND